jgi:hypothetical protein
VRDANPSFEITLATPCRVDFDAGFGGLLVTGDEPLNSGSGSANAQAMA